MAGAGVDLLVGSANAELGSTRRGLVAFVPASAVDWSRAGDFDLDEAAAWVVEGALQGDFLGSAIALWQDRDGDGRPDAVVGSPGYDHPDFGADAGALWEVRSSWFADADGDGAFAFADCDEGDGSVGGGLPELCDGLDNDCDGALPADEVDGDGDGSAPCAGDCDDRAAAVRPGAEELCDGLDTNCDGLLAGDPTGGPVPDERHEFDADGDGVPLCAGDCDDARPSVSPLGEELCEGFSDEDCDGVIDEGFDGDGDGFTLCGADGLVGSPDDDCDDADATVYPGAPEVPFDGRDNDCAGDGDVTSAPYGCSCDAAGSAPPGLDPASVELVGLVGLLLGLSRARRRSRFGR